MLSRYMVVLRSGLLRCIFFSFLSFFFFFHAVILTDATRYSYNTSALKMSQLANDANRLCFAAIAQLPELYFSCLVASRILPRSISSDKNQCARFWNHNKWLVGIFRYPSFVWKKGDNRVCCKYTSLNYFWHFPTPSIDCKFAVFTLYWSSSL